MPTRRATVRWKTYTLLERAVEEGVASGWRRAHKHTSTPDIEVGLEQITRAVMAALTEIIEFDEEMA